MNEIKEVINNYINNITTLKAFEDSILLLMETKDDEMLDEILEDIAYTSVGNPNKDLMSEDELKEKLKEHLKTL